MLTLLLGPPRTIKGGFMSKVTALISDDRPVIRIYGEDTDDHVEIGFETQSDATLRSRG
jgi:hypothetical protein